LMYFNSMGKVTVNFTLLNLLISCLNNDGMDFCNTGLKNTN